MRRTVIMAALITAAIASAPAGAVVDTASSAARYAYVNVYEPTATGSIQGDLYFVQQATVLSSDAAASPAADLTASGYVYTSVSTPCCSSTFASIPTQAVSPTALTMDAAGNSARITATLTSNLGPIAVDLTLTRPTSAFVGTPCTNGCVNAWFDPSTNQAGASNWNYVALVRQNYTVSGALAGNPIVAGNGWNYTTTATQLVGSQVVTTP